MPLDASDTRACLAACRKLGARVQEDAEGWTVEGIGPRPNIPDDVIDVGNSGTTLYLAAGVAALQKGVAVFTGDEQIRSRPVSELLTSLGDLGARAESTRGNGSAPFIVGGGLLGGRTSIECRTSQYLSSLLLSTPLADGDTVIEVPLLNEAPYIDITTHWLERQKIRFERDGYSEFRIPGGQMYAPFEEPMAGDFSSATFFFCAAAITGSTIRVEGLDMTDPQGDKAVVGILEKMGCTVRVDATGPVHAVELSGGELTGGDIDINATPDALPALSVVACFADGDTRLMNVPQAREKETDRIAVMCEELGNLGAEIQELGDGLIIHGDPERALKSTRVDGRSDHRIVMALAIAALRASGPIEIETAESVSVTFPKFFDLLESVRRT